MFQLEMQSADSHLKIDYAGEALTRVKASRNTRPLKRICMTEKNGANLVEVVICSTEILW